MRFKWGFDEEDTGCKKLKLEMLQQIMTLRQSGVTQFYVACDYGVGLYAAEAINILRETDPELQLYCVMPHEEQATKWAPYLRERYFTMLEKCTLIVPLHKSDTPNSQIETYYYIVDHVDILLAVYDTESIPQKGIDLVMSRAMTKGKDILLIHPDSLEVRYSFSDI